MTLTRLSGVLYGWLLRAYPAGFRDEYADEMLWCFMELCSAAQQQRGQWGVVRLWLRILPDWSLTVLKQRLQQLGFQGAEAMDTTQFNAQLPSTLALFSRALRDGYNIAQALEIVANYAPEPTRSVFAQAKERLDSGVAWLDVFQQIQRDLNSTYVQQMLTVFQEQLDQGGNLADRVDALNREIYTELGDTGWAKDVDLDDGYDVHKHYPLN